MGSKQDVKVHPCNCNFVIFYFAIATLQEFNWTGGRLVL